MSGHSSLMLILFIINVFIFWSLYKPSARRERKARKYVEDELGKKPLFIETGATKSYTYSDIIFYDDCFILNGYVKHNADVSEIVYQEHKLFPQAYCFTFKYRKGTPSFQYFDTNPFSKVFEQVEALVERCLEIKLTKFNAIP